MENISSTPVSMRSSANFRLTMEQKAKLRELAISRGEYIQDYIDKVFENIEKVDILIYG